MPSILSVLHIPIPERNVLLIIQGPIVLFSFRFQLALNRFLNFGFLSLFLVRLVARSIVGQREFRSYRTLKK